MLREMVSRVAVYSINNYKKIKKIYLHDYELQNILVNYSKKEIDINLRTVTNQDTNTKKIELFFIEVRDLQHGEVAFILTQLIKK